MVNCALHLGNEVLELQLPEGTDILSMSTPQPLSDPAAVIADSFVNSIGSPGLDAVIQQKLQMNPEAKAAVVISDNTRPVPYKGESGILWPVIQKLLENGIENHRIVILVATGTHRPLSRAELEAMLDPRVFQHNIPIKNHDCRDKRNLVFLGETVRGSRVYINRDYIEADIKILTGLVESHFMAGASGGRKSVCPGLIGEESTYVFHGAPMLSSPMARDLVLEGNPCHEEALEVAKKAGVDYIVNVTLDHNFKITGVFSGDLEKAHQKAVETVFKYAAIPIEKEYDIVVTHAGFVGINHYQAAKVAVASLPALKPNGKIIIAANNTDADPVGSPNYRTVLHLLKIMGAERFNRLLLSQDWTFVPEQWQVQMWSKLFLKTAPDNLVYFSPQLSQQDYRIIPGVNGSQYLPDPEHRQTSLNDVPYVIQRALQAAVDQLKADGRESISIAYLADGPYGIPVKRH